MSEQVCAQFAEDDSGVTLTMGETRVMTVVTAALEPPYRDRANEGSLRINVEFSPMASPNFEAGRPGTESCARCRSHHTRQVAHLSCGATKHVHVRSSQQFRPTLSYSHPSGEATL